MDAEEQNVVLARRFILATPPGELRDVLKSLKTLMCDDDLFFNIAPELCLEHHARHQNVLSTGGGDVKKYSMIVSLHNQLAAKMKQFAKKNGYFHDGLTNSDLRATLETALLHVEPHDVGDRDMEPVLEHVFFDTVTRTVSEIEPMEERVVRSVSFSKFVKRFSDAVTEESNVPSTLAESFFGTFETGMPLMGPLVAECRQYLKSHYACESDKDEAEGDASPPGKVPKKQLMVLNGSNSAITVVPNQNHDGGESITVILGSSNVQRKKMWSGRWKSMYVIDVDPVVGTVTLNGETKVYSRSAEDEGHIHIESSKRMSDVTIENCEQSTSGHLETAQLIIVRIAKQEDSVQREILHSSHSMDESALKGLRRKLPITKQLFDFKAAVSSGAASRPTFTMQ